MIILGWALILIGAVGILGGNIRFIQDVLPNHYGQNPGFGAYEVQVLPGWLMVCAGVAVLIGLPIAALIFLPGVIVFGFAGHWVAKVFGSGG